MFEVQLSTILLPVAVAPREIDPVAAAELDDLLDEATEGAELDLGTDEGAELDAGTEEGALDAPPQIAAVNCALFLPTPATCANLSFTHCGVTGE